MFCERAVWNHSQQIMFTSSFPVFCNIRLRSMLLFWSSSSSKYAFRLMIEVVCVLPILNWSANSRHDLPDSASCIKAILCRNVRAFRFFDMITLEWRNWYWIYDYIDPNIIPFTKVTRQVQTGNWRPSNRRRPKQLWCRKQATNVGMYSWQVFAQYLPSFDVRITLLHRSHELHHCTNDGVFKDGWARPRPACTVSHRFARATYRWAMSDDNNNIVHLCPAVDAAGYLA